MARSDLPKSHYFVAGACQIRVGALKRDQEVTFVTTGMNPAMIKKCVLPIFAH